MLLRTLVIAAVLQFTIHAQGITSISALTPNGQVSLESVIGVQQAKQANFLSQGLAGTGKNQVLVDIPNDQSSVRLRASDVQGFLVSTQPSDMNAAALSATELRVLVVKKHKDRQFVSVEYKSTAYISRASDPSPKVLVSVVAVDDHTVKITPKVLPLLPGEYAFRGDQIQEDQTSQRYEKKQTLNRKDMGHYQMYCFAIE